MNKKNQEDEMVSVCTITYKHANFIKDTIEGVLMQDVGFPIEFIIADDNSPDQTEEIILSYIEKHPKGYLIKYTKHSENKGMMGNFIWALEQCRGKYVALCEGDDYWTDPLKLQKQVDFLETNPDFIACFHDVSVVDENKILIRKNKFKKISLHDYNSQTLIEGRVLPALSVLFRNVTGDLPDEFRYSGLGDKFLSSFLGNYGSAKYMNNIKPSAYRVGNHGIWANKDYVYQKKLNLMTVYQLWRYYERIGAEKNAEMFFRNLVVQGYRLYPYLPSNSFLLKIEQLIVKFSYIFFKFLRSPKRLLAKIKLFKNK